jgi:uncharacterized membrane protein
MENFMQEGLMTVVAYLVPLVEAFGILVIVLEVIRTVVRHFYSLLGHRPIYEASSRIKLAQGMVMGLEFLVAADILKTALSPTWNEMLSLGSLIGVRTALDYFVERELKALDSTTESSTHSSPIRAHLSH